MTRFYARCFDRPGMGHMAGQGLGNHWVPSQSITSCRVVNGVFLISDL